MSSTTSHLFSTPFFVTLIFFPVLPNIVWNASAIAGLSDLRSAISNISLRQTPVAFDMSHAQNERVHTSLGRKSSRLHHPFIFAY